MRGNFRNGAQQCVPALADDCESAWRMAHEGMWLLRALWLAERVIMYIPLLWMRWRILWNGIKSPILWARPPKVKRAFPLRTYTHLHAPPRPCAHYMHCAHAIGHFYFRTRASGAIFSHWHLNSTRVRNLDAASVSSTLVYGVSTPVMEASRQKAHTTFSSCT